MNRRRLDLEAVRNAPHSPAWAGDTAAASEPAICRMMAVGGATRIVYGVHHTVIDTDPDSYPVEVLKSMKDDHERLATPISEDLTMQAARALRGVSVHSVHQQGGITAHTVNIHVRDVLDSDAASRLQRSVRLQLGQFMARGQRLSSELADPRLPSPHGEVNEWIAAVQDFLKLNVSTACAERFRDHAGIPDMRDAVRLYGSIDFARKALWQEMYVCGIRLKEIINELDSAASLQREAPTRPVAADVARDTEIARGRQRLSQIWSLWLYRDDVPPEEAARVVGPPIDWVNQKLEQFGEAWRVLGTGRLHDQSAFELP